MKLLEDDIDGGEAHEQLCVRPHGGQYEIDLSSENATKLRDARPFISAGRLRHRQDWPQRDHHHAASRWGNPETPKIRRGPAGPAGRTAAHPPGHPGQDDAAHSS
ncbi:Lsr2 family protein [Kocuria rhizophila]|nr:Lsr2 family protein [Kocuria rhizophila]